MTRSLPGKFMRNSKGLREGFPFFSVGGRDLNRKKPPLGSGTNTREL